MFFIISILLFSTSAYSAIFINEVLANGITDPESEWVELFNNEVNDINLIDWNISETSSNNFTLNALVPAKGFVVLARDIQTFNLTYPNVALNGIQIINISISNFNLDDTGGEVRLYNISGDLVDLVQYSQASGKTFENVSIGRYPDGSSSLFNLSTITPGSRNDNQPPILNKWINPSKNNSVIGGIANVVVNITDDASEVDSAVINFNGTNFSMLKNDDLFEFLWNTSLNQDKSYNITILFNDSYGKSGSNTLFNITINNKPTIISFSPPNLTQIIFENSTINFNVNATDNDDLFLNFEWFIDDILNSTNAPNFSYALGFSDNGTHNVNVTIKDSSSNQVSLKWVINVLNLNRAPFFDEISNKTISKNTNLSFNISANDFDDDELTFSSNHSEISISKFNNTVATVSWKPKNIDIGNNTINFTVSDGISIDSKIVIISVGAEGNTRPIIISSPKTTATISERYFYKVEAIDLDNDVLSFSLKSNLTEMRIDSTGVIAFVPSSAGFFNVNVSVTDFVEITNQSYNLTVKEGSRLKITDIDIKIDGRKSSNLKNNSRISKEAKPGSTIEFKIEIKNDFSEDEDTDIEDIEVEVTIEDIDGGSNLEDESNKFDLRAQDDKSLTLSFRLPLNIEEDIFDVTVKAEGEDENGNFYEQDFELELEVEKDKHSLRFLSVDANPTIISCNRVMTINYKIINIGQENEEDVILEIKNDVLGIDIKKEDTIIESGTEDNIASGLLKVNIKNDVESSFYPLTINVYSDDGELQDTKNLQLNIKDCIIVKEEKSKDVVVLIGKSQDSKKITSTKEKLKSSKLEAKNQEFHNKVILLMISTFVFALFFIVITMIMYLRTK
ncbi:lamin tail domain-containing protein [Candidatus Woesearchaeota archaeon]|nr:lamin tail domain-containing protein [Candidatus Woesearchaeota archaeon]